MRIRIGYVAIALNLPKVTASSNVTYTYYEKQNTEEKKLNKLKQVTLSNLDDLYKILKYNVEHNIHFYRVTSHLVPLATHPQVKNWDYRKIFKLDFERIGRFIAENHMRIDTHPDEFNVMNSLNPDTVENTKRNLWFHVNFFKDINYDYGKMVLHVGSGQGGKEASIKRFIESFRNFPKDISSRLMIENDDKVFNAEDVLGLCKEIGIPMVLDVHHYICNNSGEKLETLIKDIFGTWRGEQLPPKIHFSSPREGEKDRKHADYIYAKSFIDFIELCKELHMDMDFDVMLEAKQKDLALFKLVEELRELRRDWKWIDDSTFEV